MTQQNINLSNIFSYKYLVKSPLVRALAIMLLVLFSMWLYGLKLYVDTLPRDAVIDETATDGIVIFTGGSMRLETGIKLLNENKAKKLFVSGVGENTSFDEMLILSGKLPDNILELKQRIDLGYNAKNTKGNAVEVKSWVTSNDYKAIRLVTANYHMRRSYFELSNAMSDIKIIQHPVFPEEIKLDKWWQHGVTKRLIMSEYNKYIARRIVAFFGW